MEQRWTMLAVLFLARLTMAFQFQSVAALSPLIARDHGASLADLGVLLGLYLAPGAVVALPGGAVAARFGDQRIVALGLLAMLAGGAVMAEASGWRALVVGRLLAGAGGVVLNVVMTKMLVDWFAGREISTAMALFVNSWPIGIALALLTQPRLSGTAPALWAVCAVVALGLAAFLAIYRAPPDAVPARIDLPTAPLPWEAVSLAGVIWAVYNAALAMIFGFAPALLVGRGWSLEAAGSATSLFMVAFALCVPLGGILADRTGRRDAVIAVSCAGFAVLAPLTLVSGPVATTAVLVALGAIYSLAAGPIMTLPADVLDGRTRAFGMGVFFTIYYVGMMAAPPLAGAAADASGSASAALLVGVALALAAIGALWRLRRIVEAAVPAG